MVEAVIPFAALIGQVLTKGRAAGELASELFGRRRRLDPTSCCPTCCARCVRRCLVDRADDSPARPWADLVDGLAGEVTRLPLLLVLTVDGPRRLGEHEDDEPVSLYVARRLCGRGVARLAPARARRRRRPRTLDGAAAMDVLTQLRAVTGGRSAWGRRAVAALARDAGPSSRALAASRGWQFAPGGRKRMPAASAIGQAWPAVGSATVRNVSETIRLTILFEDGGDGWIMASIPEFPGVFSQGRDRDEARMMVRDALRESILANLQRDRPAPIADGADIEALELVLA